MRTSSFTWIEPHSFPRSAWERRPRRSASRNSGDALRHLAHGTRSVRACVPTRSVGTRSGEVMSANLYPCGLTRREALWQMGGGFAGLALTALLDGDGFFQRHAGAAEPSRTPHFPTKAKSVMLLMMNA